MSKPWNRHERNKAREVADRQVFSPGELIHDLADEVENGMKFESIHTWNWY